MNSTNLKRSYSVSDSDDCSEEDGQGGGHCAVTSGSQIYRSPTRKRRRGVIEKRRRDRINCSLDELKRLVPQALEKSGSAKLEKAEILQMTVDHLKVLHSNKVYDMNGSYKGAAQADTHKIATDYHGLGFRECASEVARYLISIEGLDDIRLRLMSHLQMFLSQKEFSSRALQHGYSGQTNQASVNQYNPPNQAWAAYPGYYGEVAIPKSSDPYPMSPDTLSYFAPLAPPAPVPTHSSIPASTSAISSTTSISSAPTQTSASLTTLTSSPAVDHWSMMNNGFGVHNNNQSNGHQFTSFATANSSPSHNAYGKPYRPWGGAEMAC